MSSKRERLLYRIRRLGFVLLFERKAKIMPVAEQVSSCPCCVFSPASKKAIDAIVGENTNNGINGSLSQILAKLSIAAPL